MIRAVLDSNVIASALMNPDGTPGQIVQHWSEGIFALALTNGLLAEYERSIAYPRVRSRIHLDDSELQQWLRSLRRVAEIVAPADLPSTVFNDPDDDKVIACALGGRASYVVTGDKHLLTLGRFGGIEIATPAVFLYTLREQKRTLD